MALFSWKERLVIPTYDNTAYATTGRVEVDELKCNGCGVCVSICPGQALYLKGCGKSKKAALEEEFPQCMSCNDCAAICERDAISVTVPYDFGFHFKKLQCKELAKPHPY